MGHKAYFILIPACHVAEQLTSFSVWWTGSTSTAITPPGSVSFPPLPNRSLTFCPLRPWLGYNIIIVYPTRWQQKTNKLVYRFLQQLFHPEGTRVHSLSEYRRHFLTKPICTSTHYNRKAYCMDLQKGKDNRLLGVY